jgi:hypothetical protein
MNPVYSIAHSSFLNLATDKDISFVTRQENANGKLTGHKKFFSGNPAIPEHFSNDLFVPVIRRL